MRFSLFCLGLFLTGSQLLAQPIYRRGGFQFAFSSDSVLTSDFFYAHPQGGKKVAFAVPANIGAGFVSGSGNSSASLSASVFPTIGFRSGKWTAEGYLGVSADDPSKQLFSSSGFAQKPLNLETSSGYRTFVTPGFVVKYDANKHFSFSGGFDKNFIGEGYYSMLLSDNASNTPFFKGSASFWKVKYSVLYTKLENNESYQIPGQLRTNKFATTHVIAIKPSSWFEVQLFESIVWQSRDSLYKRGFDLNYFNPVIFFRPVEFSLGSSDNAMLGGGFNFRFAKNFTLYTQILLDEFLLRELKAMNGWWANKFALQGGAKWYNAFHVEGLNLLGEVNIVKPYTYSHASNNTNYGHNYSSLAHPWGANFYQALLVAQYKTAKHRFLLHTEVGRKGFDRTATESFGGNIFVPYTFRGKAHEYGNFIAQGNTVNILNASLLYAYNILPKRNIEAYAQAGLYKFGPTQNVAFSVGLRTPMFNSYANY